MSDTRNPDQAREDAGQWKSKVVLSESFLHECIENPVPVDLCALKNLQSTPQAKDAFTWLLSRLFRPA